MKVSLNCSTSEVYQCDCLLTLAIKPKFKIQFFENGPREIYSPQSEKVQKGKFFFFFALDQLENQSSARKGREIKKKSKKKKGGEENIFMVKYWLLLFGPKITSWQKRSQFGSNAFKNPSRLVEMSKRTLVSLYNYYHFTFQASFCVGILRSRCFLQPSI